MLLLLQLCRQCPDKGFDVIAVGISRVVGGQHQLIQCVLPLRLLQLREQVPNTAVKLITTVVVEPPVQGLHQLLPIPLL